MLGRPRPKPSKTELALVRYPRPASGEAADSVQEVEHDVLDIRGGSRTVLTCPRQQHLGDVQGAEHRSYFRCVAHAVQARKVFLDSFILSQQVTKGNLSE